MTDSTMKIEDGNKVWRNVDGKELTEAEFNERAGKLAPDAALCQQQGDDLWICRRRVHEGTTCYYFFEPVQKYEVKK